MAVAVLISSPAEADRFTAIGLDFASRLNQPLVAICLLPSSDGEKKKAGGEKKKSSGAKKKGDAEGEKKSKSKTEKASEPSKPKAGHAQFTVGSSYAERTRECILKHMGTLSYGFVKSDVVELPCSINELRKWLVMENETKQLGTFEIETLLIPIVRGPGTAEHREPKNSLFEVVQCQTIMVCVDQATSGRLPLNNIGVCGENQSDILTATRFARSLSESRITRFDPENRESDRECVIMAIPGKANQTRIDNNGQWNKLRKDDLIPVSMVINPVDSRRERIGTAIDDKIRDWFYDYQMTREKRVELSTKLEAGAESSPEYILFMAVATFLACIGLIQDSAAVIIGAMLVAPLMTPLLGAGLAMIYGNRPLFGKALRTILLGVAISFCIGTLVGLLPLMLPSYLFSGSGLVLTNEMIARSQPNLLDPFIGLAAGLAGGFAIGRDGQIGTVAGVAIAAALVPPIATAGLEASLAIYCTWLDGNPMTFFRLLARDPIQYLESHDLVIEGFRSTINVRLITAPLLLFALNACATIIGAFVGLRMVGMHRTKRPKLPRQWVPAVFVVMLMAVIVFLMILPWITLSR